MTFKKRAADTQSKETTYAGLPKSIFAWRNSNNGFTANTWNSTYYDQILYNYGGYILGGPPAGAFYPGVVIPEPGIYNIRAQSQVDGSNQVALGAIVVNGATGFPFPATSGWCGGFVISPAIGYGFVSNEVEYELHAGDWVGFSIDPIGFNTTDAGAGSSWLRVRKLSGQY